MRPRVVLPQETVMYSVHKVTGQVITHRLPYGHNSPFLKIYEAKGFTYERPAEAVIPLAPMAAPVVVAGEIVRKAGRPKRKYRKRARPVRR